MPQHEAYAVCVNNRGNSKAASKPRDLITAPKKRNALGEGRLSVNTCGNPINKGYLDYGFQADHIAAWNTAAEPFLEFLRLIILLLLSCTRRGV
eukprot:IDg2884t1